jgi:hypothetical protein
MGPTINRENRKRELDAMLNDPVLRIVLERRYFEITKSTQPSDDIDLVTTILDAECPQHQL